MARQLALDGTGPRPFAALRAYVLPLFLSAVLALPTVAHYFFGDNEYIVAGSVFVFLPALVWLVVATPPSEEYLRRTLMLVVAVVAPLVVSIVVHLSAYSFLDLQKAMVRVFALVVYMTLAALMVCQRDDRVASRSFCFLGLWMAGLFTASSLLEPVFFWGRFMPGNMQPNWWGEVLIVTIFGAAFLPTRLVRYGLMVAALGGLVLIQSRSGLVGACLVTAFAILHHEGLRRLVLLGAVAVFALPPVLILTDVVLGLGVVDGVVAFVANDVLLLDDPRRGLGSGATGRAEGWIVALQMFANAPFLGVGFGVSSPRVAEITGEALHNGHLILLTDLGALLYLAVATAMLGAMVRLATGGDLRFFGFLLAYLVVLLVQPRSINVSVVPMLTWILITMAWLKPKRREAAIAAPPPRPLGARWRNGASPAGGASGDDPPAGPARWAKLTTPAPRTNRRW
jgi:hypothetical protein